MSSSSAMSPSPLSDTPTATFRGNDRFLFGMIMGVLAFWLFAQTTLNIAPEMEKDLGVSDSVIRAGTRHNLNVFVLVGAAAAGAIFGDNVGF